MAGGERFSFDIKDMDRMESLALEESNRIIGAIEVAVASWEAAGERPVELRPRILKLKDIHRSLSVWERSMLLSLAKKSMERRIAQLARFAEILGKEGK